MKVLVNVVCKTYEKDSLLDVVEKCRSQNHDVTVNICDYTLEKNIANEIGEISSDGFQQRILNLDFEDASNHDKKTIELAKSEKFDVVIDLDANLQMEKNFLDDMELETFKDNNYGCLYTDFFSKTKNDYKVYVHQKSFPLVSNSLPLIAFSFEAYSKNINNDNPKGFIISSMVSKHIKKALCSIKNA